MSEHWSRLVRSGEGLQVEFKVQMPQLSRLARTLSAFANSSGGFIFFGVDNDGRFAGLHHFEGTRELVEQVAQFHCDPPLAVACHAWEPLKAVPVLVVEVPEAELKPVKALDPHQPKDAWPYFRSGKENLPIDKRSLKAMRRVGAEPVDLEGLDEYEVRLMNALHQVPRQTLSQLARSLNTSDQRIRRAIVNLEQNGWINAYFNEKRREFSLAIPWKRR
jgi:predicted HTH transcriptional regulator